MNPLVHSSFILNKVYMNLKTSTDILFLADGSPWPAHSGAALRSIGLLRELSKEFSICLVVLSRQEPSVAQRDYFSQYVHNLIWLPLHDSSWSDKFEIARISVKNTLPYHSAAFRYALLKSPVILHKILTFPGVVFTSVGHWGTLVAEAPALNWILNQCDADVEFWRVYATQVTSRLMRYIALANLELSRRHYPSIYTNVGRIISVCNEDRQLTLELAPKAHVDVIENGIDCLYYRPDRRMESRPPRLLFTGTSVARNMKALHQFTRTVWPMLRVEVPNLELIVAGNFSEAAQSEYCAVSGIHFTGRVEDIRPFFNQSDIFIAPFEDTHGSKLKIAEAMAMSMAVVSTEQGVRGFSLKHGESVLIGDNKTQFTNAVLQILRDPNQREYLGKNARYVAETTIDWAVLGHRLRSIVRDVRSKL